MVLSVTLYLLRQCCYLTDLRTCTTRYVSSTVCFKLIVAGIGKPAPVREDNPSGIGDHQDDGNPMIEA
ncbi:uncharacterized protein METZ01_LOCUS218112 [marine metagenome]|uniref:Uncharacterized protein n=1 Tax=marine metagenome TaxID=408172 RepID=A0A382FQA3_9ZZZZ